MKIIKKPLTELRHPERNVRIHSSKQIEEFKRSVEMFGQIRPIVVDEEGVILAGNGLYDTLIAMGVTTAECYVVTGLSDAQKKKLMLADNRIFGLGVDDLEAFDSIIAELGGDLDIPGYDEDLLASMVADAEEVTATLQEYGTLDEEEVESIRSASERKEQKMEAAESSTVEEDSEEATEDYGEQEPAGSPEQEVTRRYVICPKCGEKIWL